VLYASRSHDIFAKSPQPPLSRPRPRAKHDRPLSFYSPVRDPCAWPALCACVVRGCDARGVFGCLQLSWRVWQPPEQNRSHHRLFLTPRKGCRHSYADNSGRGPPRSLLSFSPTHFLSVFLWFHTKDACMEGEGRTRPLRGVSPFPCDSRVTHFNLPIGLLMEEERKGVGALLHISSSLSV
jgi:hypothetical protein